MHPSPPRIPRGRTERPSRVRSECAAPESPTPRDYPRALGEHATCPRECFLFHRILENTQKIVRTLEMHNKSNFDPKNVIPIFMALNGSILPRKNTKPGKKTKLPLGKTSESKLYLFVSRRFLRPKFMKIYQ